MCKKKVQKQVCLFLIVLMSVGLIIATLHSHHPFHWNHSKNLADTGSNLSTDAAYCPICGYTFKIYKAPVSQVTQVFKCFLIITTHENNTHSAIFYFPDLGRAPPVLA